MVHRGPPHFSNEGYAYAKRMIEVMDRLYAEEYGCHFTAIVPTNIYGPYDNYEIEGGHVVPGLIHKFYKAKQAGEPVVGWGSGKRLRQFIYNIDMGELILWVLREYEEIQPIILSVDEADEVPISEVVEYVADAIDYHNIEVSDMMILLYEQYDHSKADGQFKKTASNAKLRKYLPDYKFTPMRQGIKETVDWFVANYDKARK